VLTQQRGRGLRRARDKSSVTVIDLIGQQHREFRFEDRLRAILDARRGPIVDQVEDQFPFLPAGCTVDLDRQSRELILNNLKAAVRRSRWATLVADLRTEAPGVRLADFLDRHGLRLEDVYRGGHSWTELQRDARHPTASPADSEFERRTLRALGRMTHVDDPERVDVYCQILAAASPPDGDGGDERRRRLLTMLAWDLGSGDGAYASLSEYFSRLWMEEAPRRELSELLGVLDKRSQVRRRLSQLLPEVPLTLHGRYTRAEVIAALGFGEGAKPKVTQGGILWIPQVESDVFFVDLRKAERDYSPTTMYRDYAITRELFHWESQSRQHTGQPTVRRYIEHDTRGTNVLLFVREKKTFELGTQPFTFLGPVKYVVHEGERPVAFTWRLPVPMPEELFEVARSVAAA